MASLYRSVIGQVLTQIRAINGAGGGYTYDLSDAPTERVLLGLPPEEGSALSPQIFVHPAGLGSQHGHDLGGFRRTGTLQVVGFVGADSADSAERILAASDLLDDIVAAIEADRSLGGRVIDCVIGESAAFDGDQLGLDAMGMVTLTIEPYWRAQSGAGT